MYAFHTFTRYIVIILLVPLGSLTAQIPTDSQSPESISFSQALQRAIAANPRLELNDELLEVAAGQTEQAKLRPNPSIGADFENFLGTGTVSDIQGLEVIVSISQVIETAHKRLRRTELAEAKEERVDWDREVILTEIETSLRIAFVDVLIARKVLLLRQQQLALTERSAEVTQQLVEAARLPQVKLSRVQLAVRQQDFAVNQAEQKLLAAKSVLASYWSETSADLSFSVVGEIPVEANTLEFSELASKLVDTAALGRYSAEEKTRKASLRLEQSRATPDVEVFTGGHYFNQVEDAGFLFGVKVPWPVFDKNQGNIRSARAQLRAVRQERDAVRREMLIALNRSYQQLLSAQSEMSEIQSKLLPAAEANLRDIEKGYERGQFDQLEVLESRGMLFEIREAYLNALQRYAIAQAEILALTLPAPIHSLSSTETFRQ
jgi:outer membrane protein, heavy metal efflux system